MELRTFKPEETAEIGRRLGQACHGGEVLALTGELGAGKTLFIKGLAMGLEVTDPDEVVSPSFIILREHKGRVPLYHLDFYRLENPRELTELGIEEYFYGTGVCAVEWADKFPEILPEARLEILIEIEGEETRRLTFTPRGRNYETLLAQVGIVTNET